MCVCVCSPCRRGKESDENWKFNIYARKPQISREAEDEISAKCLHRARPAHTLDCVMRKMNIEKQSKTAGKKWIICYRRWFYLPIHAENVKREKENRSISATLQDSLKDPWRSHSITQWGSRLLLETPRNVQQCAQRLTEKKKWKKCVERNWISNCFCVLTTAKVIALQLLSLEDQGWDVRCIISSSVSILKFQCCGAIDYYQCGATAAQ